MSKTNYLRPNIESLTSEAVLVQAWKKASSYVRHQGWVADSLEWDISAFNLQSLIPELQDKIRNYHLTPSYLRFVPAPKSCEWKLTNHYWKPVNEKKPWTKIRPLAHVSIQDQVIAMAMLICFADIVENIQGDPSQSIIRAKSKNVVSYGHRLLCDNYRNKMKYRWGNSRQAVL